MSGLQMATSVRLVFGIASIFIAAGCSTPGDELDVAGIKLCWCPAGTFRMGSPVGETGRRDDEAQVDVTLSKGFWMGKYEVTQRQWIDVMGALRGSRRVGNGDDFPVYWISYLDAEEFCRRLTQRSRTAGSIPKQWEFRLPTEAQWEYACRAGTTTAFSFGATLSQTQANFGRWEEGQDESPDPSAEPVGSYPPNRWGLHDMHGNEFEWCRDWYHRQLPGGIDPDCSDVRGEPNRDRTYSRVRRGGAWTDQAFACRSAFRLRFEPERSANHIGFRVALVQR